MKTPTDEQLNLAVIDIQMLTTSQRVIALLQTVKPELFK